MNRQKYYKQWRYKASKQLKKQGVKIQTKSIHKLQQKISRSIKVLNERKNNVVDWTFKNVSEIVLKAIGTPCIYCKTIVTWKSWSLDHRIPVAKGGDNSFGNIQVIDKRCNRRKGSFSHEYFLRVLKFAASDSEGKELLVRLGFGGSVYSRK